MAANQELITDSMTISDSIEKIASVYIYIP